MTTTADLAVYQAIARRVRFRVWSGRVRISEIARGAKVRRDTAQRAIRRLEERAYIAVERARGQVSTYRLLPTEPISSNRTGTDSGPGSSIDTTQYGSEHQGRGLKPHQGRGLKPHHGSEVEPSQREEAGGPRNGAAPPPPELRDRLRRLGGSPETLDEAKNLVEEVFGPGVEEVIPA